MTQQVKPPPATRTLQFEFVQLHFQSSSLLICFGSCIHVGDSEEAPASGFSLTHPLAVAAIWGMNQG